MKILFSGLFLIFCGGCSAMKPSAYLGVQQVTPYQHPLTGKQIDRGSCYINLLWDLGSGFSFQFEPIFPLSNSDKPLLRLAIDKKIF